MYTTYDVAKLTEFDCWCCTSAIVCDDIGGMRCRAVFFANMSYRMIMDGKY